LIEHNLIYDNESEAYGAGIFAIDCTVTLINNTITLNRCAEATVGAKGGGLFASNAAYIGQNNIVCDNFAPINPEYFGTVNLTYSCCPTAISGEGNITDDPMFEDPDENDFHLEWGSPCINAGDPTSPLDPDSTIADIGVYFYDMGPGFELRPNAVTDITASHHNELLIATLSWINPTVNTMGDPLTDFDGVKIYRDGLLIDNLTDVSIGESCSYDDSTIPAPEEYEYEVVPYNIYGDGIGTEISCWIGLDRPGAANNAAAVPDPNHELICTISWDDPTEGEHAAYWPAGSWTGQRLYRNGALLVDLLGTNNTFVDYTIYSQGFFSYGVSYYNESGEGPITPASPDPVFVGTPDFEQIPYSWIEISLLGTNTGLVQNEQTEGPFDIGFRFPFFDGTSFNSILVNSNGRMSFTDSPSFAYSNDPIPYPASPNNLVAPYWDDLQILDGAVYYFYDAVNDRFIVEYKNVSHQTTGGNYTFETILYPNGDIEFMYQDITPGTVESATVGIENATGTNGLQVTYNGSGPIEPASGIGIRIYSVIPEPQAAVLPDSLLFPETLIGETSTLPFMITNLGDADLYLDSMKTSLPEIFTFNWDPEDSIVVPGSQLFIQMSFTPSDTIKYEDVLQIYTNDVTETLPLQGLGIPPLGIENQKDMMPFGAALVNAYPNPFNPSTTFNLSLPEASDVTLSIYDVHGRLVSTLVDGYLNAGIHDFTFNGVHLASGLYFFHLDAVKYQHRGKVILLK